jgi:hypothetical protein
VASHGEALLGAGANIVWSKPIPNPAVLREDLRNLLNRGGAMVAPAPHGHPEGRGADEPPQR